jgi:hypothetical protein
MRSSLHELTALLDVCAEFSSPSMWDTMAAFYGGVPVGRSVLYDGIYPKSLVMAEVSVFIFDPNSGLPIQ